MELKEIFCGLLHDPHKFRIHSMELKGLSPPRLPMAGLSNPFNGIESQPYRGVASV